MKNTKKKILALLAVLVVALGLVFAVTKMMDKPEVQKGAKDITVVIIDKSKDSEKELLNKKYDTDAEFLGQLLDEHNDEVKMVATDGGYGRFIDSIMGIENVSGATSGSYWMIYRLVDGNYVATDFGIDEQPIANGETYGLFFESLSW